MKTLAYTSIAHTHTHTHTHTHAHGALRTLRFTVTKAVVSCQNKIILKKFRPEPPPSVDRPKIILFQHGTTSKIRILRCFSVLF